MLPPHLQGELIKTAALDLALISKTFFDTRQFPKKRERTCLVRRAKKGLSFRLPLSVLSPMNFMSVVISMWLALHTDYISGVDLKLGLFRGYTAEMSAGPKFLCSRSSWGSRASIITSWCSSTLTRMFVSKWRKSITFSALKYMKHSHFWSPFLGLHHRLCYHVKLAFPAC